MFKVCTVEFSPYETYRKYFGHIIKDLGIFEKHKKQL